MDANHFDHLTKSLTTGATRRGAMASILAAALSAVLPLAGKTRRKRKNRQQKRKRRNRRRHAGRSDQSATAFGVCYPGSPCTVEEAANLDGCDLSGSTELRGANCTACSLMEANLSRADLTWAKLEAASLDGACLIDADLREADIEGASFDGAIFCRTLMPDGSVNDSGCDRTDACCSDCPGGACARWDGCTPLENVCVPLGRPCCANTECIKPIPSKFVLWGNCESLDCTSNAQCEARFPFQDVFCETDTFKCPGSLRGSCCLPKSCDANRDCPHSGLCCAGRCCTTGQICTPTGCYGAFSAS